MKSLFRVLSYLRPYKFQVFTTLSFAVLATLADMVPPWLIKIVIDHLVASNTEWTIYLPAFGLVLAYLGRNFFNYKRIMLNNRVEQKVVFDLRSHVFRRLQTMSLNYFESRSTGEIMSRVNDDVTSVERIFIDGIEQTVTAFLTLIGVTIILYSLHWKLALVSLIPIPFLFLGAWKYTHRAQDLYYAQREKASRLNSILQDIVSGIKETLSFNRQAYESDRFDKRSQEMCVGTLDVIRIWAIYSPTMKFVGQLGTVFILLYGIGLAQAGEITVGTLVAFIGYLALFYAPIDQLHSVNNLLQQALASGKRLFEIIDAKPEVEESPQALLPSSPVRGAVAFRDVGFSYLQGKSAVQNISFTIQPGEKIALVGHTGSGKSTVVKLLMRFYDANSGEILIDEYPIRSLQIAYLREQIGLVSQEPFLFNGTVAENIRYGSPEASKEQIARSAQAANAEDFILNLARGYDTLVGERGVKLSGGERHRIAIARAFLKNPPILILDEATASVDTETESRIKSALNNLMERRTTLIIAHRLSTLEGADRIIALQNGRIVETGTHRELMSRNSVYANLFKSQVHL